MRPMNAVNGNSNSDSDCGGSSIEQNCIQDDNDDDNTMSDTTMAFDDLPRHIAFICDGNSRWSEQQQRQIIQLKLPGFLPSSLAPMSTLGHAAGANRVVRLIDTLLSMRQKHYQQWHQQQNHPLNGRKEYPVHASIQYCTLFAFSTENWSRPYQEVAGLFQLLEQMAIHYSNHDIALREGRVRIQILGDMEDERIPISTRRELRKLEVKSKLACDDRRRRRRRNANDDTPATTMADIDYGGNLVPRDEVDEDDDALTICLAINYGGRADILRAATELALSIIHESSSVTSTSSSSDTALLLAEAVNEAEISKRLCTSALPNVDLIVRTGGERRLSNFLLWEGAYAELYFTDVFWPDFDEQELEKALVWYGKRNRRYGGR
jgi:undecaprenyl diphosphate synthase